MNPAIRHRAVRQFTPFLIALAIFSAGCLGNRTGDGPTIEFTRIPKAAEGGPQSKLEPVEGRVFDARAGQRVVLYARSGAWWVQPYADRPFTSIEEAGRWRNVTRAGTEYAALLVEAGYVPPPRTDFIPQLGDGVVAVAVTEGAPPFWRTGWFILMTAAAVLGAIYAFYRVRMRQLARQLNLRFEERLAERMRIAQDLHDTLLQGLVSASMQLHVAADQLPVDSAARTRLGRVQQLMRQVIDEGRNAVRGLRSGPPGDDSDLGQAFAAIEHELVDHSETYSVIIGGQPRPIHPLIRDEIYRIGREALMNAVRHAEARNIEVKLDYEPTRLRVSVRDDGRGIDPEVLRSGRDGHWGLSGMRERAERIGARLKISNRDRSGTEVEMSIPAHIAFQPQSPDAPADAGAARQA
jgi:signal transduction histidine kinase